MAAGMVMGAWVFVSTMGLFVYLWFKSEITGWDKFGWGWLPHVFIGIASWGVVMMAMSVSAYSPHRVTFDQPWLAWVPVVADTFLPWGGAFVVFVVWPVSFWLGFLPSPQWTKPKRLRSLQAK